MKAVLATLALSAIASAQAPNVLSGVYTKAQAARGQAAYATHCARCHGEKFESFSGPPLTGDRFLDHWREFPLKVVFDTITDTMPWGAAGTLKQNEYLDITARILEANEIPAGNQELTPSLLSVTLVGKNGHQPLPTSSPVETSGCMTLDVGNGWFITGASEPARTLDQFELTPGELSAAKSRDFGTGLFRLQNLADVPGFKVDPSVGTKVALKGTLVLQAGNPRINVTAIQSVAPSCEASPSK